MTGRIVTVDFQRCHSMPTDQRFMFEITNMIGQGNHVMGAGTLPASRRNESFSCHRCCPGELPVFRTLQRITPKLQR